MFIFICLYSINFKPILKSTIKLLLTYVKYIEFKFKTISKITLELLVEYVYLYNFFINIIKNYI